MPDQKQEIRHFVCLEHKIPDGAGGTWRTRFINNYTLQVMEVLCKMIHENEILGGADEGL